MRIIVRIPLSEWAVRHFISSHRNKLEPDGKTIRQTAKDFLGKIITAYMQKTCFEAWSMAVPNESHLRVAIPVNYSRNGLTKQDIKNLSDILTDLAQREIVYKVAVWASEPGVSRALAIREIFSHTGITDEEYDMGHFRRYFDRYSKDTLGVEFLEFRKEITRTLIEIYGESFVKILSGE